MYRLYSKVTKGLEPIGSIFKQVIIFPPYIPLRSLRVIVSLYLMDCNPFFLQHITDEGTALVQQAEDAAISKV